MDKTAEYVGKNSKWANEEFIGTVLGDKRLNDRLISIVDNFTKLPESSINQACGSWSETKAAYRFFQNDNVEESSILASHVAKTVERIRDYERVLVIQDTSYISYTSHKKTKGLGIIGREMSHNQAKGIIMHTAFTVSTEGLALGILDQDICSRPPISEETKNLKRGNNYHASIPIEDKESIKWLKTLKRTNHITNCIKTEVITVCDREADIYDFFELAQNLNSAVLVRAQHNRDANKKFRYTKHKQKLLSLVKDFSCAGAIEVRVPAKDNEPKRTACLDVRFGKLTIHPSKVNFANKTERLPTLPLYAIYVIEKNPHVGSSPLEWVLLTNLSVNTFDEAVEKVSWYCLRWKIEIFHKILKSGLKVEECRLGTAKRLIRYLTVMSIIAWRIFFITLISRENPTLPCTSLLTEEEWKILYIKIHNKPCPNVIPTIKDAVLWIAQLGGYLARKNDPEPGPITLWKGWRRLFDLTEGFKLIQLYTCG